MSDQPDQQTKKPFLYVGVCAAGIADDVGKLITAAQEAHWDVGVIATPQGLGFIDTTAVEAQTGRGNAGAIRRCIVAGHPAVCEAGHVDRVSRFSVIHPGMPFQGRPLTHRSRRLGLRHRRW